MEFYKILKEIMAEKNLTIPQVARLTNLSDSTVRSIFSRKQKSVALDVAAKLSKGLQVSYERLNGEPEPEKEKAPAAQSDEGDIQKQRLIHNYDRLNPDGQVKLVDYSEDLTEIPKYTEEEPERQYRTIPYSTIAASAGAGEDIDDNSWADRSIPDLPEYKQADFAVRVHGDSMLPDYEDGDIVLIHQQDVISEGAVGLFWVKGKGGVIKKMGRGELISINPEYENIVYDTDKGSCFGKVIGKLEK